MMKVPATEVKNNFGKYLRLAAREDIVIMKNGKEAARLTASPNECGFSDGSLLIRENAAAYSFDGRKVPYEKFLEIRNNTDERYEYIDGRIYLLASPKVTHQQVLYELAVIFHNWFKGKKCTPAISPFDIELQRNAKNRNMVQPDLMVICDLDEKTGKDGYYKGVPTLIAEIVSHSTKSNDFVRKLDLYMSCGVCEYWIVDPENRQIHVYLFKDKEIAENKTYAFNDRIKSFYFEDFSFELSI